MGGCETATVAVGYISVAPDEIVQACANSGSGGSSLERGVRLRACVSIDSDAPVRVPHEQGHHRFL